MGRKRRGEWCFFMSEEGYLCLKYYRHRQLGKQRIMTEELIEKATYAMEKKAAKSDGTNIRRLTGR
jgi:hypothetical protein